MILNNFLGIWQDYVSDTQDKLKSLNLSQKLHRNCTDTERNTVHLNQSNLKLIYFPNLYSQNINFLIRKILFFFWNNQLLVFDSLFWRKNYLIKQMESKPQNEKIFVIKQNSHFVRKINPLDERLLRNNTFFFLIVFNYLRKIKQNQIIKSREVPKQIVKKKKKLTFIWYTKFLHIQTMTINESAARASN